MELYGNGAGINGSSTDRVAEWATPGQETGLEGLLCWFAFDYYLIFVCEILGF